MLLAFTVATGTGANGLTFMGANGATYTSLGREAQGLAPKRKIERQRRDPRLAGTMQLKTTDDTDLLG